MANNDFTLFLFLFFINIPFGFFLKEIDRGYRIEHTPFANFLFFYIGLWIFELLAFGLYRLIVGI